MMTLRFSDTPVPYTRFLDDLAEKVVEKIEQRRSDPAKPNTVPPAYAAFSNPHRTISVDRPSHHRQLP